MARLLGELTGGAPHVPVIYLSNGPWNLAGPLRRFLERNGFPPGALLLTDWGPTPTRWFRDGRAHKRSALQRLAGDLPGVRWTLVGDTGEHDPALYEEFARARPDRVRAVLLRDMTRGATRREWFGPVPVVYGQDGDALAAAVPPEDDAAPAAEA
jgi:phosphatidate phosphatase APP1